MINIPRIENGDIDYKQLGFDIEHCLDIVSVIEFWDKFKGSTDRHMANLAIFACFKSFAMKHRELGNVDRAMSHEKNADTVYERIIEHKW